MIMMLPTFSELLGVEVPVGLVPVVKVHQSIMLTYIVHRQLEFVRGNVGCLRIQYFFQIKICSLDSKWCIHLDGNHSSGEVSVPFYRREEDAWPFFSVEQNLLEAYTRGDGITWRSLSKPPQRQIGHDPRPLWLLFETPLALAPEFASDWQSTFCSFDTLFLFPMMFVYCILLPLSIGWLLVLDLFKED